MAPMRTEDSPGDGVVFPVVEGTRSTTGTGRAVVADALRAVAPELAREVLAVPDWRSGYLAPFREMTRLALVDPAGAGTIAADGLGAVRARFRFRRGGGDLPPEVAAIPADGPPLSTVTVQGRGRGGPDVLSVPYAGGRLVAEDLDAQLDRWLAAGTTEPSFAAAVRAVMAHPGWLDLADLTVV